MFIDDLDGGRPICVCLVHPVYSICWISQPRPCALTFHLSRSNYCPNCAFRSVCSKRSSPCHLSSSTKSCTTLLEFARSYGRLTWPAWCPFYLHQSTGRTTVQSSVNLACGVQVNRQECCCTSMRPTAWHLLPTPSTNRENKNIWSVDWSIIK